MKYKTQPSIPNDQTGFTIMELLIATVVFSIILLIITIGVTHFTRSFYKGINSSNTQNTTRSIIDTVSQSIQFGASDPIGGSTMAGDDYWCIGNKEYVFNLGQEVKGSSHGLLEISGTSCTDAPVLANGKELLQQYMRLAQFDIERDTTGNLWVVTVSVAYADNDAGNTQNSLLCAPTAKVGSCSPTGHLTVGGDLQNDTVLSDLHCKSSVDSQFCDVVTLSTAVGPRVNVSS